MTEVPVTAKITLTTKTPVDVDQTTLQFHADYGNGANQEWAKYTPSLTLTMTVLNSVADKFEVGHPMTLTFEHC